MMALLLDHGASLEAQDDYGQGPQMELGVEPSR